MSICTGNALHCTALHCTALHCTDIYRNKDEEYEYSVPVGAATNNGTTKVGDIRLLDNGRSERLW